MSDQLKTATSCLQQNLPQLKLDENQKAMSQLLSEHFAIEIAFDSFSRSKAKYTTADELFQIGEMSYSYPQMFFMHIARVGATTALQKFTYTKILKCENNFQ